MHPPLPLPQGYQAGGYPGLALGVFKAAVGVMGRPTVGVVEALSKFLNAAALAALGR